MSMKPCIVTNSLHPGILKNDIKINCIAVSLTNIEKICIVLWLPSLITPPPFLVLSLHQHWPAAILFPLQEFSSQVLQLCCWMKQNSNIHHHHNYCFKTIVLTSESFHNVNEWVMNSRRWERRKKWQTTNYKCNI